MPDQVSSSLSSARPPLPHVTVETKGTSTGSASAISERTRPFLRPVNSSDDIFPRLRGESLFLLTLPEEGIFFLELDGRGVERFLRRPGLRRPGESPPLSRSGWWHHSS